MNKFFPTEMKAVIVAGGTGERLRPITDKIPKPMVKVGGKPILLHTIEHLKKYGVSDLIIALCYLPDPIINFFSDGREFGVNINYIFEDPNNPMGTAGAIVSARSLIGSTFIVTYADILRELDVTKMINFHKKSRAFATINVYKRESKEAKSMVLMDDNNRIFKFIERPQKDDLKEDYIWVNGSFYILESEIFEWIPESKKSDFGSDIFPKLLSAKKTLYAYPTTGYFIDIGDYKKLKLARKTFNGVGSQ